MGYLVKKVMFFCFEFFGQIDKDAVCMWFSQEGVKYLNVVV